MYVITIVKTSDVMAYLKIQTVGGLVITGSRNNFSPWMLRCKRASMTIFRVVLCITTADSFLRLRWLVSRRWPSHIVIRRTFDIRKRSTIPSGDYGSLQLGTSLVTTQTWIVSTQQTSSVTDCNDNPLQTAKLLISNSDFYIKGCSWLTRTSLATWLAPVIAFSYYSLDFSKNTIAYNYIKLTPLPQRAGVYTLTAIQDSSIFHNV